MTDQQVKARLTHLQDQGWAALADTHADIVRISMLGANGTERDTLIVRMVFSFVAGVLFQRRGETGGEMM